MIVIRSPSTRSAISSLHSIYKQVSPFFILKWWTIKTFILKYGGSTLYQRTRYFFLGMIIGTFVTSGTWLVIDYLTGRVGNMESNML